MKPLPSKLFECAAAVALALSPACGGGGDGGGGTTPPPPTVTAVVITSPAAAPTFGALGRTVQFAAQPRDAAGNVVSNAAVTWSSSNTAAATVSGAGLVTAVANGSTQIRAASGGIQSSPVTVTVSQVAVTLTATPTSVAFGAIGSARQLAASVADSGGAPVAGAAVAFTRIGPGTTATVSAAGLVTATGVGTGDTAVASASGLSAKVPITVAQLAASITVTSTSATPDSLFTTGRQRQFSGTARDSNANALAAQPALTWSSSSTPVATVDGSGLVTAVADGGTTIMASGGGANGTRALVVRRFPSTFTIAPTSAAISTAAGTQVFNGTAQDSSGANLTIAWVSRAPATVTVSPASGTSTTATAAGNGTTYVVMSANARSDSAQVTVTNQASVSFSGEVQPIFTANCALANCHTGATPTGSMNLTAGVARANIVNVNAVGAPGNIRVIPGNASNSYLIRKLEGGPNIVGGQMPEGQAPLPAGTILIIRNWINQGALNN